MSYRPSHHCGFDDNVIEGVTVCVDYADFLDETLSHNLAHFDRFVVVTSHKDKETQRVCAKYSVECVVTDVMHEHKNAFNKGAAINLGLAYLRQKGWIVHMDADVALPDRFRNMLQKSTMERDCIYGAHRFNVVGAHRWRKFLAKRRPQFHERFMLDTPEDFPIGATLVHKEYGYCPIGYFQMWHGSMNHRYPIIQGTAEHTDVLFALKWPRAKRVLLPTVRVFHLESEKAPMGRNWSGRKTKKFR